MLALNHELRKCPKGGRWVDGPTSSSPLLLHTRGLSDHAHGASIVQLPAQGTAHSVCAKVLPMPLGSPCSQSSWLPCDQWASPSCCCCFLPMGWCFLGTRKSHLSLPLSSALPALFLHRPRIWGGSTTPAAGSSSSSSAGALLGCKNAESSGCRGCPWQWCFSTVQVGCAVAWDPCYGGAIGMVARSASAQKWWCGKTWDHPIPFRALSQLVI